MNNHEQIFSVNRLKDFDHALQESQLFPLTASDIEVLQINFGYLCNQSCKHCHVEAGPDRKEIIGRDVLEPCLNILMQSQISTVDITGGAPEMNPNFEWFIRQVRNLNRHVLVRCNLTILQKPGYEHFPQFYADHQVEVIASLPYYSKRFVNSQRGDGAFEKSIEALQRLNKIGYGDEQSGLILNLVYNPNGAFLPPSQATIEVDFKRELFQRYSIRFNQLFTIANMPIGRFQNFLTRSGNYEPYMQRLIDAYNPQAAEGVMCRYTLSVGWEGSLYDCDFNQMLKLNCNHGAPDHINNFDFEQLKTRRIVTGMHCYGCTAGAGSSCGGAVVE
ncbi:MAG: arsenosugar biosynthesis radical SAM protein ArsS [bacterium]|nr:arsenosugar biosynthesis radical SAM protein ArsS [bacterium]